MNGILYRIFNIKNGKSYIGKTYKGFYLRLQEHIRDSTRYSHRPLYRAMTKYGLECFSAEILGEFPESILEEFEIFYIKKYNSYGNSGYNATKGGDGSRTLKVSNDAIINMYGDLKDIKSTATKLDIDEGTCRTVLINSGIELLTRSETMRNHRSKKVLSLDTGLIFNNVFECAEVLLNADIVDNSVSNTRVAKSISRVCTGERFSYKNLKFIYIKD